MSLTPYSFYNGLIARISSRLIPTFSTLTIIYAIINTQSAYNTFNISIPGIHALSTL